MENVINKTERIIDPRLKNIYLPLPTTYRGAPTVINSHPKEPMKIVYCSGKLVIVRDLLDPQQYLVYKGHNDRTTVATFAKNGYWIASGDCTGKVRVWSYDHPEHILKLELMVFNGEIKDIQWDLESKRIVVVGDGKGSFARVFVWDTGNSLGEIVGPQKRILSVDYKPTRPFRIITGSEDFNVCFFEGPPFKFKRSLTGVHTNFVNCVRYSPNGEYFIAASSDKSMSLYKGKEGEFISKLPVEHQASVYSVSWNPEGTKVLSASADKTLKIWNVLNKDAPSETTVFISNPTVQDMQVASLWLNNDIAISLSLSGNLNVLDAKKFSAPIEIIQGHQVNLLALDIAVTAGVVFTGSYDGVTCLWDIRTGKAKRINNGHNGKVCQIVANDTHMASIGWDDVLRVFLVKNASLSDDSCKYETAVALDCQPNGVCMPMDFRNLQVVSTNKGLVVVSKGSIVSTKLTNWTPTCVAISNDARLLAVGSDDSNKIYLYSLHPTSFELTEVGVLVGHLGKPTCMSFSPTNQYLAIGDTYREVRVWDLQTQTEKIKSLWVYHTTTVTAVDWSPDGKHIASGSLDEYMYIWNIDDPMTREKYEFAHKDGVTGLRFYDANQLFSIGNDGCVNQWKVETVCLQVKSDM